MLEKQLKWIPKSATRGVERIWDTKTSESDYVVFFDLLGQQVKARAMEKISGVDGVYRYTGERYIIWMKSQVMSNLISTIILRRHLAHWV